MRILIDFNSVEIKETQVQCLNENADALYANVHKYIYEGFPELLRLKTSMPLLPKCPVLKRSGS